MFSPKYRLFIPPESFPDDPYIPRVVEESGIAQGGFPKFLSGVSDHCREARHERRQEFWAKADAEQNRFFNHERYIPLVIQESVFGRVQSAENQLKKRALYYTNTMPFFLVDLSAAFNPAKKPILESRTV